MKVIKDNMQEANNTIRCTCEWCGSILDVDITKDVIKCRGLRYFKCPCCKEDSYSDELNDSFPNKNDVSFPEDYFHYGDDSNTYKVSDDEINKYVKQIIDEFDENDDDEDYFRSVSTGDTIVFVVKNIGENLYNSYVCKNYYEANIEMEI